jgi:hypothetical protein
VRAQEVVGEPRGGARPRSGCPLTASLGFTFELLAVGTEHLDRLARKVCSTNFPVR